MTDRRPVISESARATEKLGDALAADLLPGDVILLEGDLAAGKTTLIRGLAEGLGADRDEVSSPTFVLIQTYLCNVEKIRRLHHVDLYRLEDRVPDLRELGLEELLSDTHAVVTVEWPKGSIATWLPGDSRVWRVRLTVTDEGARHIEITAPA